MQRGSHEEKVFENKEFNRFGLISVILLVVGCLGGLATGLGGVENVWSLSMLVIPTMITLSLLIAVAPMKYILTSAIIASTIDVLFIAYFLIA